MNSGSSVVLRLGSGGDAKDLDVRAVDDSVQELQQMRMRAVIGKHGHHNRDIARLVRERVNPLIHLGCYRELNRDERRREALPAKLCNLRVDVIGIIVVKPSGCNIAGDGLETEVPFLLCGLQKSSPFRGVNETTQTKTALRQQDLHRPRGVLKGDDEGRLDEDKQEIEHLGIQDLSIGNDFEIPVEPADIPGTHHFEELLLVLAHLSRWNDDFHFVKDEPKQHGRTTAGRVER